MSDPLRELIAKVAALPVTAHFPPMRGGGAGEGYYAEIGAELMEELRAALAATEPGQAPPKSFRVTDDLLDAPDGAEVLIRYRRVGRAWEQIAVEEALAQPVTAKKEEDKNGNQTARG